MWQAAQRSMCEIEGQAASCLMGHLRSCGPPEGVAWPLDAALTLGHCGHVWFRSWMENDISCPVFQAVFSLTVRGSFDEFSTREVKLPACVASGGLHHGSQLWSSRRGWAGGLEQAGAAVPSLLPAYEPSGEGLAHGSLGLGSDTASAWTSLCHREPGVLEVCVVSW